MRWCWLLGLVVACSSSSPPCPSSPPASGAACTRADSLVGLACEYGGGPNTTCTTDASCSYGNQGATQPFWTISTPSATCEALDASCPAAYGDREGTACATTSPDCTYDGGVCGCLPCETPGAISGFWHCRPWDDVAAGCPVPRPHLGDACTDDGLRCDYAQCCGGPALGPRMTCKDGYWSPYLDTTCSCGIPACPT